MTTSAPTGYLLPRRETFVALSGVLLAMLVAAINQTVLTTAMPRMIEDLGGLEYYSWVFSGYVLALAVTAPIYGNLSDIHGARPLMLAGLTIFLVGSVVGATADTMLQVVIARIVLGIGAGRAHTARLSLNRRPRAGLRTGALAGHLRCGVRCRLADRPRQRWLDR